MKHVTYYDKTTGLLNGVSHMVRDAATAILNTPEGHAAIDHPAQVMLDHLSQRVDIASGHVVEYQPPAPSADHEWNATTKRWQLNAAARQKALDQSLARHLESQQHGLMRRLALNPGDVDARAQLQALHDQITGLDGQQP